MDFFGIYYGIPGSWQLRGIIRAESHDKAWEGWMEALALKPGDPLPEFLGKTKDYRVRRLPLRNDSFSPGFGHHE